MNKTDNRIEDPREVRHCEADPAVLWIDDPTGKLVDHSSRPEPQRASYEMTHPEIEIARLPMRDVRPAFIDLVGPRSPVTMEDGARAKRMRLPSRVVRLLPARGGGS